MTAISLVSIKSVEGCNHFIELQRRVWGSDPLDVVPNHVTVTVLKNGGALLGAYAEDGPAETGGMVGAALWWIGASAPEPFAEGAVAPPTLKICSHMAGVLPAWQGKGVGRLLKLRQREMVLAQGLSEWVTWTYDPLQRVNAVFNIHRLGATCNSYYRNVYGVMHDELNAGSPSDRFQVDWRLQSERVVAALASGVAAPPPVETWQILPTAPGPHGLPQPVEVALALDGSPLALPIPDDINLVRRTDSELGLAWRLYVRNVAETAFAGGYVVVDCLHIPEHGWHYLLMPRPAGVGSFS